MGQTFGAWVYPQLQTAGSVSEATACYTRSELLYWAPRTNNAIPGGDILTDKRRQWQQNYELVAAKAPSNMKPLLQAEADFTQYLIDTNYAAMRGGPPVPVSIGSKYNAAGDELAHICFNHPGFTGPQ